MEDLRPPHFSLNAIAILAEPCSRDCCLIPPTALRYRHAPKCVRLPIHSFTNQPVRLLRVLRYTPAWASRSSSALRNGLNLAIERNLQETITSEDAGEELRAVAREERPAVVLKAWEEHDLLEAVNPVLAKKHPLMTHWPLDESSRDLFHAGFRPRLAAPMLLAILGKLKDREMANVLSKAGFRFGRS